MIQEKDLPTAETIGKLQIAKSLFEKAGLTPEKLEELSKFIDELSTQCHEQIKNSITESVLPKEIAQMAIGDLGLRGREMNVIKVGQIGNCWNEPGYDDRISTVGELMEWDIFDLINIHNFGMTSLREVVRKLYEKTGLKLKSHDSFFRES